MIYSKNHLTLTNKLRKPVLEKHRSYQQQPFLGPEILNQQPVSKLEKATILELTVCFLRQQQQYQPVSSSSCSGPVNQGCSRCVQEIVHFLSKDEVKKQSQRRLLSNFQSLQPSSDKNRKECPASAQLPNPAQHEQRLESSQQRPLEALVESYRLKLHSQTITLDHVGLKCMSLTVVRIGRYVPHRF
ncbi:transcription factor HES-2-like [Salmo trutta]|nr:transcription factor HES-2-like [Salmo trutta]